MTASGCENSAWLRVAFAAALNLATANRLVTRASDLTPLGQAQLDARCRCATSVASTACPQLTALFTSAAIRASSAAVNSFSANEVGHMAPSSRFALSLKPIVAYLVLNF
jgi:hypothetical protein